MNGKENISFKDYYSSEEVYDMIDSFSDEDSAILMSMAKKRWRKNNLRENRDGSPQDLLYQAIYLTLGLKRKWKRNVAMRIHFYQLLRNIAGKWANKGLQATKLNYAIENEQNSTNEQLYAEDPACNESFVSSAFEYARKIFSGDRIAYNLLISKTEGLTRKQIIKRYSISELEYETISKRINRKLKKQKRENTNELTKK